MTKKNYVRISDHLQKILKDASEKEKEVIYKLVELFIVEAKEDNPRFNEVKFRNAVKIKT
jgi:hypothetical protein